MEISSPRELIAAIPHLLGFNPDDSLVVIALDNNHVHSMVRVDWPISQGVLTGSLARYAQSITGVDIVLCFYSDSELQNDQQVKQVFAGSELLDILVVAHGQWNSALCEDEECCPASGRRIDEFTAVATAEFIFAGSSPYASREDLVKVLSAETTSLGDRELCATAFAELPEITEPQIEVEWLISRASDDGDASWADIARTALALQEIRVRDGLLRLAFDSIDVRIDVRGWLMRVMGRIPEHHVAACATVLAGVVWLDGNGSLARIALDRALDADPDYSLAQLLDTALVNAVPSRIWTESLEAVSYDECLRGAA